MVKLLLVRFKILNQMPFNLMSVKIFPVFRNHNVSHLMEPNFEVFFFFFLSTSVHDSKFEVGPEIVLKSGSG